MAFGNYDNIRYVFIVCMRACVRACVRIGVVRETGPAVILTLLDGTLVHRRYLPNSVCTHLQLSRLRQSRVNEIA